MLRRLQVARMRQVALPARAAWPAKRARLNLQQIPPPHLRESAQPVQQQFLGQLPFVQMVQQSTLSRMDRRKLQDQTTTACVDMRRDA